MSSIESCRNVTHHALTTDDSHNILWFT